MPNALVERLKFLERWRGVEYARTGKLSEAEAIAKLADTNARFPIGDMFRLVRHAILAAADLVAKPYKGPAALSKSRWLHLMKYRTEATQQSYDEWQLEQATRLLKIYESISVDWHERTLSTEDYETLQSQLCSRVIIQGNESGEFEIYEFDGVINLVHSDFQLLAIRRRYERPGDTPESLLRSIEVQSESKSPELTKVAQYRGWRNTLTGQEFGALQSEITAPGQPVAPKEDAQYIFRKVGDTWEFRWDGGDTHSGIIEVTGFDDIRHLLAQPGIRIPLLNLPSNIPNAHTRTSQDEATANGLREGSASLYSQEDILKFKQLIADQQLILAEPMATLEEKETAEEAIKIAEEEVRKMTGLGARCGVWQRKIKIPNARGLIGA